MRYSINAGAVAVLLAAAVPAGAQTSGIVWGGPYGGLSLGADWGHLHDSATIIPGPGIPGASIGPVHTDGATIIGGGQTGYNFQFNNFVFGVEGDIRGGGPSVTNTVTASPVLPGFIPGDSFKASSDWNASMRGRIGFAYDRFLFYGTGGLALTQANLQANYASPAPGIPGATTSNSRWLAGPTYGGGVEYAVAPNISVGGEYRHTDYGSVSMPIGGVPTPVGNGFVLGRVGVHDDSAMLKVNYHFGAPPPPPPPPPMPIAAPAPPPAAPKVFIVYFDWDKDAITADGMQVVQAAADAYKSGAPVQIQVTGYTDRSGSSGYNQRLSERRANNVANALAQRGVPREQMVVSGHGENDNRVPTAAGVREKENRRVEIMTP
jgi:OmpA-OmpF porin, OOP family